MAKRQSKFKKHFNFNMLNLRDTIFAAVISVFPVTLILFKEHYITWYVLSGYVYGLVSSSMFVLMDRRRRTTVNISIEMVKMVILMSTFAMLLMNDSTSRVELNTPTILFFFVLFICIYYEIYKKNYDFQHKKGAI